MQEPNETLDQFHTRLRTLSETCEFADLEIEQQSIVGETSTKIRKRALRNPTFDLKSMLIEGRRDEQSIAKKIESNKEPSDGETKKLEQPRASSGVTCRNCVCLSARRGGCAQQNKRHGSVAKNPTILPLSVTENRKKRSNQSHQQNELKYIKTMQGEMNQVPVQTDYLYSLKKLKGG